MSAIKLTYFDIAGRAEAVRLSFHIGGIAFEDKRVSFEEWGKLKAADTFIVPYLPVMEVDGVEYSQSNAMLRFAGRKAGLYPDGIAQFQIDEALELLNEVLSKAPTLTKDDEVDKKARAEYQAGPMTKTMALLEKKCGDTFYTGELSIADLQFVAVQSLISSGNFSFIDKTFLDAFPKLTAAIKRTVAHEKIAAYYKAKKAE